MVVMDEMTIYAPQTPEQWAEALELASAQELIIAKHSISVAQSPLFNSISSLFVMTKRDTLIPIETFFDALTTVENVEALQTLFTRGAAAGYYGTAIDNDTGIQYSMASDEYKNLILQKGLQSIDRYYPGRLLFSSTLPEDFVFEKGQVRIVRGILTDGDMIVTKGIVQAIVNDYGNSVAARFINDATKIATIYNETIGLTVGINDITPEDTEKMYLNELRDLASKNKIEIVNKNRQQLIIELKAKKVAIPPMLSLKDRLDEVWNKTSTALFALGDERQNPEEEAERRLQITKIFDDYNNATARLAKLSMRPESSLTTMFVSGAKGSETNAQRMFATTSAQFYRGGLPEQNLSAGRSTIYAPRNSKNPAAYGLSRQSFLQGYDPMGYGFHSASGREGLTDTQTGTSDAGVIFQALIKAMENITVSFFGDVRDNQNNIYSYAYPFNAQDMQSVKIEGRDVLSCLDINRMAMKINSKKGFGKNGEKLPALPKDQVRLIVTKPEITKLIDMSRNTTTSLTFRDKNGLLRNSENKIISEIVNYFEPIREIKERISSKNNIPIESINFVYKGQTLEDKNFLSDYIKVQTNEETLSISLNQGTIALQMLTQNVPAWFVKGETYTKDEKGNAIIPPVKATEKSEDPNSLSYVDNQGNVRRVFGLTFRK